MKILIVDDYWAMRRIVRNLLTQLGYSDVEEAADGATALEMMRAEKFGLVFCDWNMNPMTGLQLLKEIRADKTLMEARFIMVFGDPKPANVLAAKEAGINEYIIKPFSAERLREKIRAVI